MIRVLKKIPKKRRRPSTGAVLSDKDHIDQVPSARQRRKRERERGARVC